MRQHRNPRVNWFERVTGFIESSYEDTQRKLAVDGGRLRSLVNNQAYGIRELELVSLQSLRERVHSEHRLPGRLQLRIIEGERTSTSQFARTGRRKCRSLSLVHFDALPEFSLVPSLDKKGNVAYATLWVPSGPLPT